MKTTETIHYNMIVLLARDQAIEHINHLSREGRPFVFIIDYLQNCSYIEEVGAIDSSLLRYNLNGFSNHPSAVSAPNKKMDWRMCPETFPCYEEAFNVVQRNIRAGNSFLTNLTVRTPIATNYSLEEIYTHSKAMYKLWVKDAFVVFSPEIFVRIRQGRISSYPMKGTLDASLPWAEKQLIDNPKEAAEHATIVDLIRNDLSMVANEVTVDRYRYIDVLQTHAGKILQTSSEISGKLPDDYLLHLGDILFRLLPAGSITGAPKRKTMEIIAQAEGYERGFYTGIMGYFDGANLDSGVMIRFIEQEDDKLFFKSGGGITCQSDSKSEYNEMIQKVYVPIY